MTIEHAIARLLTWGTYAGVFALAMASAVWAATPLSSSRSSSVNEWIAVWLST